MTHDNHTTFSYFSSCQYPPEIHVLVHVNSETRVACLATITHPRRPCFPIRFAMIPANLPLFQCLPLLFIRYKVQVTRVACLATITHPRRPCFPIRFAMIPANLPLFQCLPLLFIRYKVQVTRPSTVFKLKTNFLSLLADHEQVHTTDIMVSVVKDSRIISIMVNTNCYLIFVSLFVHILLILC